MNLNQLKIFYFASKLGSLSAAGEELNITQPAVTKGIQRLQDYYEIRLFNRFGKKMALTDAGEALYGIAEKIFELEKQAEESIRDFQQQKSGQIRIHASESFGAYYLPHIVNPFIKANPNIRVSASILPTEQVAENTANLDNDIGFISYPVENEKLLVREIIEDRLVIIVPVGHSLTKHQFISPRDLERQSIIMHEKGSATERTFENFTRKNNLSINILLELSSNNAIKLAVAEGLGIGVMSRKIATDEIEAGKLIALPFSDSSMRHKYYLVHHKDKYISGVLQHLIDTADQWAVEYKTSLS
ncbi:MAG: LysR family transcriptional regulator [Deltaproteobacteria bacterium]|nr:MAG: LysR family transcriptional regulator [Deltaproteobacteria bacterium]